MATRNFLARATAALLLPAVIATACVDLIGPTVGPEHARANLTLGAIVTERIDHATDVDEFTFRLNTGDEVIAFLQVEEGAPRVQAVIREVQGVGSSAVRATVEAAFGRDDFESSGSDVVRAASSREYVIAVRPLLGRTSDPGARYQLQVRLIDKQPETAPATLVAGDTVSEAIDHVGDVDEFTLSGTPGEVYTLFLGIEGPPRRRVTALVELPGVYGLSVTAAPGTPLLGNRTSNIVMQSSGTAKVRVADTGSGLDLHRGPYRLYLHRLDLRPEGRSAAVTLEEGPTVGVIDVPGDIDEYILTTTAPRTINMILTRRAEGAAGGGVRASLGIDGGGGLASARTPEVPGALAVDVGTSGRFTLPAGSYRLRVEGYGSGAGFRGTYDVEMYVVNPAPESIAAAITIGEAVHGESFERPGDIDTFAFSGTAGDTLNVLVEPLADPLRRTHTVTVRRRTSGGTGTPWSVSGPRQSGRVQLPETGEYEVVVASSDVMPDHSGPYRLTVGRASARPEQRAAALAIGDTVRDEPLDFPRDIDEFIMRGAPGAGFGVAYTWMRLGAGKLEIIDPATRQVLATQNSGGTPQYVGFVTMPAGGEVLLRVSESSLCDPCNNQPSLTGDYRLATYPLSAQPEVNLPAIAIGDTVSGDAIDPPGDRDEFTFSAPGGGIIAVYFQLVTSAVPTVDVLTIELIDASTGRSFGIMSSSNTAGRLEDHGSGPLTLPASGQYLVRVHGFRERSTGGYRFRIVNR